MKAKTQRLLFRAIIAIGVVLPWLPTLIAGIVVDNSLSDAFRPVAAMLPVFPLGIVVLAAWWSLPFVVFANLWRRLLTAQWRPLRRDPLLVVLGVPVLLFPWATMAPAGALYVLAFLVYGIVAMPCWGLRTPVGKTVFALFGFAALVLFTLLGYVLLPAAGVSGMALLRQYVFQPLGILGYMTSGLLIGYLFAKPVDLLITRGEPVPEARTAPNPSAWLVGGNAVACGAGFVAGLLLYSRFAGSAVSQYELGLALAAAPVLLALSGVIVGVVVGIAVYLVALAMLRRDRYRRGSPLLDIALAVIPGLLIGLSPGLFGESAVKGLLTGNRLGIYYGYGFGPIDTISISPDGSRIAADGAGTLLIWDMASGEAIVHTKYAPSDHWIPNSSPSWSPDGRYVAVALPGIELAILDSRSGRSLMSLPLPQARSAPGAGVSGTALGPGGHWLVATSTDGNIYRFDLANGSLLGAWQSSVATHNLAVAALSPGGDRLAVAGVSAAEESAVGGFVAVLDAATGNTLLVVSDLEQMVTRLAFSPDGRQLLTAGTDNPPRLIDTATGAQVVELRHHCPLPPPGFYRSSLYYAAFLGASGNIAVACGDGVAEVCAASSGDCRLLLELKLLTVYGLAPHPDGRHIAVLVNGSTITLWDTLTAEPRQTLRLP
jgi:hypothetical protein